MDIILGIVVTVINSLVKLLALVLDTVFFFLPSSPFKVLDNSLIIDFIGYLNYLIPISEIVSIMTLWCTAISIYYIVQIVLRWLKAID